MEQTMTQQLLQFIRSFTAAEYNPVQRPATHSCGSTTINARVVTQLGLSIPHVYSTTKSIADAEVIPHVARLLADGTPFAISTARSHGVSLLVLFSRT